MPLAVACSEFVQQCLQSNAEAVTLRLDTVFHIGSRKANDKHAELSLFSSIMRALYGEASVRDATDLRQAVCSSMTTRDDIFVTCQELLRTRCKNAVSLVPFINEIVSPDGDITRESFINGINNFYSTAPTDPTSASASVFELDVLRRDILRSNESKENKESNENKETYNIALIILTLAEGEAWTGGERDYECNVDATNADSCTHAILLFHVGGVYYPLVQNTAMNKIGVFEI